MQEEKIELAQFLIMTSALGIFFIIMVDAICRLAKDIGKPPDDGPTGAA